MKRILLVIFFIGALLVPAFGINIRIPSLSIATRVFAYGGAMVTQTQTEMDMLVEGGYKFGGKIVIGFDGIMGFMSDPTYGQALPPLSFKEVSVVVRDLFGAPLSLSYFVGADDYLCYGNDFTRLFGTDYIEPSYRATYMLPSIIYEFEYRGIHRVNGNGIKLELQSPDMPFAFMWYLYQDQNFVTAQTINAPTPVVNMNILFYNTGIYSSDLRFLLNTEAFKLEVFAGGTIDSSTMGGYARFGALAYIGLGPVDFLLAGGLPQLDFVSTFSLDLFYLFFESRINLGPISLTPSVFMRPARYLQKTNIDEMGKIDFNLNLSVFNPRKDQVSFGAEGNFVTTDLFFGSPSYELYVRPFIAFATPGVFWEIKVSMQVLDSLTPITMESFLSSIHGLITIKAEF